MRSLIHNCLHAACSNLKILRFFLVDKVVNSNLSKVGRPKKAKFYFIFRIFLYLQFYDPRLQA